MPDEQQAANFDALASSFLEEYAQFHPSTATHLGLHQHDQLLEPRSAADLDGRARSLRSWLTRIDALRELTPGQQDEARLWTSQIKAELHNLEDRRLWHSDPTAYVDVAGTALNELVARNFAPPEERLAAAIARVEAVPRLLAQARANLDTPASITTDAAIEQVQDTLELFEQQVPRAFAGIGSAAQQAQLAAACARALEEMREFGLYLEETLRPRSTAPFTVGADGMRKLLLYEDMVTDTVNELIVRGEQELARTQELIREAAARIDPTKSLAEVIDQVTGDHPSAAELLPEAAALLDDLRTFIAERGIVSMATEAPVRCEETPAHQRFFGFAFCDTPGPFEQVATEAFYYITPPEAHWPAEQQKSYLRFFNRAFLPIVSLHETYPGHYVHMPWLRYAPGPISRTFWTTTAVEGWAHYCEAMMLDEGYGNGDPKLRLMQLQAALLRLCRYLVALRLHTHDLTYEEAIEFFVREGYTERLVAEREVRRGALNPGFYAYTLGKLEILRLREEFRRVAGPDYSLRAFHDLIVKTPYPISLIRERLLRSATAVTRPQPA